MFETHHLARNAYLSAMSTDRISLVERAKRSQEAAAFGLPDDFIDEQLIRKDSYFSSKEIYPDEQFGRISYLKTMYPYDMVKSWISLSVASFNDENLDDVTLEIANLCQSYIEDVNKEFAGELATTIKYKQDKYGNKNLGLTNSEIRSCLKRININLNALNKNLRLLRSESLRVGQSSTIRGQIIRELYLGIYDKLTEYLILSARLDQNDAAALRNLRPKIEIDGNFYGDKFLPWEPAIEKLSMHINEKTNMMNNLNENEKVYCENYWRNIPNPGEFFSLSCKNMIVGLSVIYENLTGLRATFTDSPNPSPFICLVQCVHGHVAGVLASTIPEKRRSAILSQYGLQTIKSAGILRRLCRQ